MKTNNLQSVKTLLLMLVLVGSMLTLRAGSIFNGAFIPASSHAVRMEKTAKAAAERAAKRAEMRMILATAATIYDEMDLEDSGLS
ncbi:MAG TPA: hypothetical protein VNU70_06365, partial [Puia sp.]|nr:hypothetical protein [Puia sp.]